jgi:hypothetical protein
MDTAVLERLWKTYRPRIFASLWRRETFLDFLGSSRLDSYLTDRALRKFVPKDGPESRDQKLLLREQFRELHRRFRDTSSTNPKIEP